MIIAFDPGYTTGVAILTDMQRLPPPTLIRFNVHSAFDFDWNDRFDVIRALLTANAINIDAVVYERYKLFPHADAIANQIGSEMPSSRVIGAIEMKCADLGLTDKLVVQDVWQRDQARILPAHAERVSKNRHINDAYRHAHYYARMHHMDFDYAAR